MTDQGYPDALPPQYRLHWYVLERVLGQGGFGITYLARDTNLDQPVAIKEYLPVDVATRRADATVRSRTDGQNDRYRWGLDRFIREARTLARFDHPNIVRVHSVFEQNNTAYMVMRFEEGENFGALLDRRRTLPEADLLRVLLPVLDGLELVHGVGFIHRDIKPENIHIRADGSPVLLDFGSARSALGGTRTVTILVAPGYAPFEQYYSSGESQGPWTDLYGLGATCYRAITGVPPMDAIARSKGVLGSTREILVPASTIGAGRYSPRLLKAVDHALQFAEKDRPQSLAAWRWELLDEGAAPVANPPPVAVAAPPAVAPAPVSPGARRPVLWAVAAAAVAAAASVLWLSPGADQKRIAELERRLDEQKQAQDQAAKAEVERERQRREDEQKQRDALAERERKEREAKPPEPEQKPVPPPKPSTRVVPKPKPEKKVLEPAPAIAAPPTPAPPTAVAPAPAPQPPAPVEAAIPPVRPPVETPPADEKEAFAFYRKRALAGDNDAQLRLGDMYATGRGAPQTYNTAYIWYGLAARNGNPAAKAKQAQIAGKLQPAEIQQADRTIERQAQARK